MPWVKVATTSELQPGQGKSVQAGAVRVALFNVAGTYHAIGDTCPHRGGSLGEGTLTGKEVVCPWHGARFDLTTGAHLSPPAATGVPCYRVQVVGDEVQIELP